jgi:hypothetical protein
MTDEQIIAYVDGELGPIEALRFERSVEADPALAERVARHHALRERVANHYAPVVQEAVPDRLRTIIDRGPNIISFPGRSKVTPSIFQRYGAMAATLAIGLIVGQFLPHVGATGHQGAIVAQAGLTRALDTQLASTGPANGYTIGVSFKDKAGDYCRTFDGGAASGIGCHHDGAWQIRQLVTGDSRAATDYRQAGSANPTTMQAAQDMMAGAPLNAAQEKIARDKGWK